MDTFWDDQYEGQGKAAIFWAFKADEHFVASEAVKVRWLGAVNRFKDKAQEIAKSPARLQRTTRVMRLHDPYYHLLATAIELLMKAILVGRDGNYFQNEATKDGHFLTKIAKKVGIDLSEKERRILAHLEQNLLSFGRYPMPSKKEHWRKMPGVDGYWVQPGQIGPANAEAARDIYRKVVTLYRTESEQRRAAKKATEKEAS